MNNNRVEETVWDVAVIGGGPAGMMAAVTAAGRGKRVLLLEKNQTLGKKLLITGGGRCNVSNNKPDIKKLASMYKGQGKFLLSAFSQHAVRDTTDWFTVRGLTFIEENEGRLFPVTKSAQSVWEVLVNELGKQKVVVRSRSKVIGIEKLSTGNFAIRVSEGVPVIARACVVAVGGSARPETGSTGDGFLWLQTLGHTVTLNNYALVPITVADMWVKTVSGVSLTGVKVSVYADGKKQSAVVGKILFTHVGLSGPLILNQSKKIGELLAHSTVTLKLDLLPDTDAGALKAVLQELFLDSTNKKIKNVLKDFVPSTLTKPLLQLADIDGETPCHSVKKEERTQLLRLLKALPLTVTGLLGPDKAVISAGGVSPAEIDFKTMQSRKVPGLYLVGDMINIDRPSGGYSLQICWTTGVVAGSQI